MSKLKPLRLAIKQTKESTHSLYKMGAVITKGNRVLAAATNHVNVGCREITDKKWPNTLHAEAAAIAKLLKHRRLDCLAGSTLYVTRVNKQGETRMAKPCKFCQGLIHAVGIKKVVYTTNDGVETYEL